MGSFKNCNDATIKLKKNCINNFRLTYDQCHWMPTKEKEISCLLNINTNTNNRTTGTINSTRLFPRVWENKSPWNFDNIGEAFISVFVATSGEAWPNIMYDAINSNGYDVSAVIIMKLS